MATSAQQSAVGRATATKPAPAGPPKERKQLQRTRGGRQIGIEQRGDLSPKIPETPNRPDLRWSSGSSVACGIAFDLRR